MLGRSGREWWRHAVIYQVYLRSFSDSDGDGVGDLQGLRARLDHLTFLGVDGLWINPFYPSPQADHGYDVANYLDVDPAYGTLADFDLLLSAAHERDLRVLLDIVPNHCSIEHPWFRSALTAGPGSPERDRFIFRDGSGVSGDQPPNRWRSVFGGSAWTRVTEVDGTPGQWYLHLYDSSQPDFNWRNQEVGDHFDEILRFWFDRGVDGFRIDVAHGLVKADGLPDWDLPLHASSASGKPPMWNQPEVHLIYRRWRQIADSYRGRDLTMVGEIWAHDPEDLALYLRADELPQAFYFDLLTRPWRAPELKESIQRALNTIASTGATVTWTLANHDVHRSVTRYGQDQDLVRPTPEHPSAVTRLRGDVDLDQGTASARAAVLVLLALPGSAYLYQGEELGLPEVLNLPDEARQDPFFRRSGGLDPGRDGSRVPIPWTPDGDGFGFSLAPLDRATWLPQPDWFAAYSVETSARDPESMLALYRDAIDLRRRMFVADDPLIWVDVAGRRDVLAFRRGTTTVIAVCGQEPLEAPADWGHPVISSASQEGSTIGARSAAWFTTAATSAP